MPAVVCLVTTPPDRADPIAEALVERELVACVNILSAVQSVYRWKGAVERDEEALLVIKTTSDAIPALDERLGDRVGPVGRRGDEADDGGHRLRG